MDYKQSGYECPECSREYIDTAPMCVCGHIFNGTERKIKIDFNNIYRRGLIILIIILLYPAIQITYENLFSSNVSLCDCLTDAEYVNANEEKCDDLINSELGFNWKTTNFSQEPEKNAKFNALAAKCN